MSKLPISIIAAIDLRNGIGKGGNLLFRSKEDLRRFKERTLNNVVVMGRKTFESIGHPLPDRCNIVLTNQDVSFAGVTTLYSKEAVLATIDEYEKEGLSPEIFIIGGAQIYQQFFDLADTLYITAFNAWALADSFFPEISDEIWVLESKEHFVEDKLLEMDFLTYKRRKS